MFIGESVQQKPLNNIILLLHQTIPAGQITNTIPYQCAQYSKIVGVISSDQACTVNIMQGFYYIAGILQSPIYTTAIPLTAGQVQGFEIAVISLYIKFQIIAGVINITDFNIDVEGKTLG